MIISIVAAVVFQVVVFLLMAIVEFMLYGAPRALLHLCYESRVAPRLKGAWCLAIPFRLLAGFRVSFRGV